MNVNATVEAGEPVPTCTDPAARERTAWFKIVAPQTTTITLTTEDSDFDTILAVYYGTALTSLHEIACDDDIMAGVIQTLLSFDATAGQTYFVQLSGFAGNGAGTFFLRSLLPPPNDNFAGAITLGVGTSTAGSNRAATVESGEPLLSCSCIGRTVWYRFTPSQSEDVTVTLHVSDTMDGLLAIYTAQRLPHWWKSTRSITALGVGPSRSPYRWPQQTYTIQIGGHSGTYGDYRLVISGPSAVAARAGAAMPSGPIGGTRTGANPGPSSQALGTMTPSRTPLATPTSTRTPLPTTTKVHLASVTKLPPPTPFPTPVLPTRTSVSLAISI